MYKSLWVFYKHTLVSYKPNVALITKLPGSYTNLSSSSLNLLGLQHIYQGLLKSNQSVLQTTGICYKHTRGFLKPTRVFYNPTRVYNKLIGFFYQNTSFPQTTSWGLLLQYLPTLLLMLSLVLTGSSTSSRWDLRDALKGIERPSQKKTLIGFELKSKYKIIFFISSSSFSLILSFLKIK